MNGRLFARYGGMFLTLFITPLLGGAVAFHIHAEYNMQILLVALISAGLGTGLAIGKALEKFGSNGGEKSV